MIKNILLSLMLFSSQASASSFPDYLDEDKDGNDVTISAQKGTVTVITFWATWCGFCMKELPALGRIQQAGQGAVKVIAVNLKEDRKTFRKLSRHFKDTGITFLQDKKGKLSEKFGVGGIPHLVIFDTDGKLAHEHIGYGDKSFNKIVNNILTLLPQPKEQTAAD